MNLLASPKTQWANNSENSAGISEKNLGANFGEFS